MNIILTGFMGTGKTAVGKRLAKRLHWQFIDVDELIEQAAKRPIAQIFTEKGEEVFRRLERRQLARVAQEDHQVIATGGGAIVDPRNRGLLRGRGIVVCLTASPRAILDRVGKRISVRPLLAKSTDPLARIRTLLNQRARAYAQADLIIDTSRLSVQETMERIWQQLGPDLCKSWRYLRDNAQQLAQRFAGKYVALIESRIVASGTTQLEAYQNIPARLTTKGDAGVYYIPLPEESVTAF